MGQTVDVHMGFVTFVTESCITCGVVFAMPDAFVRQLRRSHANFHCPNGHPQHYVDKTDAEVAQAEAAAARRRADMAEGALRRERAEHKATKGSLTATKGVLTRERRRTRNGVCTECRRSFANLARHMTTKHPTAVAEVSHAAHDEQRV